MCIGDRIDQLDIDPDLIGHLLDTTFKNVGNSKLLPDFGQIARLALVLLRRGARDDFQVSDFREPRQDFLLDSVGEVSVSFFFTEILKRQNGNRFFW
jgi:hypothetical protein